MMGDVVFKLADERTPDSGTILEVLEDGIVIEVSGYLVFDCDYSIELVE